jgi:hypothetical protein
MSLQFPVCLNQHQGNISFLQRDPLCQSSICKRSFRIRMLQCSPLLAGRQLSGRGLMASKSKPGRQNLKVAATCLNIAFVSAEVSHHKTRSEEACVFPRISNCQSHTAPYELFNNPGHYRSLNFTSLSVDSTDRSVDLNNRRLHHGAKQEVWVSALSAQTDTQG